MQKNNEKVKLDEILKYLFSSSHKVMIKLLNGVFDVNHDIEDSKITVSNNEFIKEDFTHLRGDVFFDIMNIVNKENSTYHIEFQTINDSTMVVRMFEYGFNKAREQLKLDANKNGNYTLYFPRQKVIFFEENNNIEDIMKLEIVLPDETNFIYKVETMKY